MVVLYIWLAFIGILALMLLGKLAAAAALSVRGRTVDWSAYNATMLFLACAVFFPIAVLVALIKK